MAPTHDYVIDNQTAPNTRADLNNLFQAIVSQNSSGSEPSVRYANMIWYDTTNNQLKKRNEANSSWIPLGTIDEASGVFTPSGNPVVIASEAEAYAGSNNSNLMTPLRVSQAIGNVVVGTGPHKIYLAGLERVNAGWSIRSRRLGGPAVSGGATSNYFVVGFLQYGTVRVYYEWTTNPSNSFEVVRLYRWRNGTATLLAAHSGGTPLSYNGQTIDVAVIPGDTIYLEQRSNGSTTSYVADCRIHTNGEDLWPAPTFARVETNRYT